MNKLLAILLCLGVVGCASLSTGKNKKMQDEISQLNVSLSQKESQIKQLQEQLAEKDAKIKDLSAKLEGFGIFKLEKKEEKPAVIKEEVKPEVVEVAPVK